MQKERISTDRKPWHNLEIDSVLQMLSCRTEGLTQTEADQRLAEHGPNSLPSPKKRGSWVRFLSQFHNPLIYLLLAAAAVTAFLSDPVDTGVIIGVVFVNSLIGFIQEGKAEKALDAIGRILSRQAGVWRDGKLITLSAEFLVPGDIVFLQAGDKVPADLRLIKVKDLRLDESVLTGESMPVEKSTSIVEETAELGDRSSMAFSGTLATYGRGSGVVVETGGTTEIGRISEMVAQVQSITTPLLREMAGFSHRLSLAIIALAAAAFAFGFLVRHYSAKVMFLAGVSLAVAAIPEALPAVMTITLAIGVRRMAGRKAIIRRLPAVETLGSVTVICSDKTGTLTCNEMTVQTIAVADNQYEVSGVGYDPLGEFLLDGRTISVLDYPMLHEAAKAALLCNDARLYLSDGKWRLQGDPTEGALVTMGLKAGLDQIFLNEAQPRTDIIPFESEHRFMATLHHDHSGHGFIYLKGAPERVLSMCSFELRDQGNHPLDHVYWQQRIEAMAGCGQRILAIAFKEADASQVELNFSDFEAGLTLLALLGLIDPPRQEAIAAVRQCRAAGIRVKMITGDHAVTAGAVGAEVGIGDGRTTLAGHELETMDDEQLGRIVREVDVFARSSPEHKLRLVKALQANGEVVAMTGDGVNDAPALKRAEIGVAMGLKGTEAAREASDMVLADDNFASIVHAIEEGRTVYDNIRKFILFVLPANGGEAMTIMAAIALGVVLPITPVQVLWVNMVTSITLGLSLAFGLPESDIMQRPPRPSHEPIVSGFFVWRIIFVSFILVAGTFGLFWWERLQGTPIQAARTIAVNTLVMFEAFYLLTIRYLKANVITAKGVFGNRPALITIAVVIIFQLFFTYFPPMEHFFGTAKISLAAWARLIITSSSVFVLVESEKFFLNLIKK